MRPDTRLLRRGVCLSVIIIALGLAAEADAAHVIPAGQEDLVGKMMGREAADLPGGCQFNGAAIQQSRIAVTYACGGDGAEVVVRLAHPDERDGGVRTEQFTISVIGGAAPPGLVDWLAARIRVEEGAWKWTRIGGDDATAPRTPDVLQRTAVPSGARWLLPAALLLAVAALIRVRPGMRLADAAAAGALFAVGAALRLGLGPWGPLRVNGLGPMWLDGAISDPGQLYGYGPGYPELFSGIAGLSARAPDMAIFAANGLVSAMTPVLAFALGRLLGLDRARAGLAAVLLVVDPVALRVGTTESYTPVIISLTLLSMAFLALAARRAQGRDWTRAALLASAAGLVLAQCVRVHPVAWIPAGIAPLIVAAVGEDVATRARLLLTAAAVISCGAFIALISGGIVFAQLDVVMADEVMAPRNPAITVPVALTLVGVGVAFARWSRPRWFVLPAVLSLAAMLFTRNDFAQSWVWQQSYDRLFVAVPLLALAAALRPEWLGRQAVRFGVLGAAIASLAIAWPFLRERTTDHLEYRWLRGRLADLPSGCLVAYVAKVDNRNMMLPIFGPPARPSLKPIRLDGDAPEDVRHRLQGATCTYYVHSSLCSSLDGAPSCAGVEVGLPLEPVARASFPAVPSNRHVTYDRPAVETVLYRVESAASR